MMYIGAYEHIVDILYKINVLVLAFRLYNTIISVAEGCIYFLGYFNVLLQCPLLLIHK